MPTSLPARSSPLTSDPSYRYSCALLCVRSGVDFTKELHEIFYFLMFLWFFYEIGPRFTCRLWSVTCSDDNTTNLFFHMNWPRMTNRTDISIPYPRLIVILGNEERKYNHASVTSTMRVLTTNKVPKSRSAWYPRSANECVCQADFTFVSELHCHSSCLWSN